MNFDTLIINGTIITVNDEFEIIENGAVGITGAVIEYVGGASDLPGGSAAAAKTIDAAGGLVMPGLVNIHTHLPMSLFRGLADDLVLDQWLNNHIFPAEQRHLSPDTVKKGARLSCAEMLLSGTTTCCDGYFYESAVADAVKEAGMRGVLGQGVIDFPAPGVPDPKENIGHAAAFARKWKGRSPLIRPSIFCHSPYTCGKETLISAKQAAKQENVLFQVHIAETRKDPDLAGLEPGMSSVKYLDSLGILDEQTLVVHAVWVDTDDIAILAKRKTKIAHAPESNMKLASGIAPVPAMLDGGLVVGLGTDGCASNNNLDMFSEMSTAARLHKAALGDPTVMDAETVIRMATIDGARAIGLEDRIGSIETGKAADLIVVNTCKPHLFPLYNPHSHIVYAARGADVMHVLIDGRLLVENGGLLYLDAEDIMAAVHAVAREIRVTDQGDYRA